MQKLTAHLRTAHAATARTVREPFNTLSHGLGALLAVAGMVLLIVWTASKPWHVVGFSIYGASLVVLFLASALFHGLHAHPRRIAQLLAFDQIAIYLLVAGTYTPICLVPLRGPWGWSLLGVVWGLAITGITLRVAWSRCPQWVHLALYLIMGWLAVIAFVPITTSLPAAAILWLVAGGLAYTVGAVVFAVQRPRLWPGFFSSHELWHVFVLGGSACHFVLMAGFVTRLG